MYIGNKFALCQANFEFRIKSEPVYSWSRIWHIVTWLYFTVYLAQKPVSVSVQCSYILYRKICSNRAQARIFCEDSGYFWDSVYPISEIPSDSPWSALLYSCRRRVRGSKISHRLIKNLGCVLAKQKSWLIPGIKTVYRISARRKNCR